MRWCSSFRLSAPDCKSPQRLTLPANAASHWLALLKASGFLRHKMWRYLFLHLLIRNILSKIVIHHHGKFRNLGCLLLGSHDKFPFEDIKVCINCFLDDFLQFVRLFSPLLDERFSLGIGMWRLWRPTLVQHLALEDGCNENCGFPTLQNVNREFQKKFGDSYSKQSASPVHSCWVRKISENSGLISGSAFPCLPQDLCDTCTAP